MVRDVLEQLMGELQGDIHIRDWRNRLALHHAAVGGHIENVVFLLQNRNCLNSKSRVVAECEVNPLRKTYRRTTPLNYAAQHGHANIIRLLVKHGASLRGRRLKRKGKGVLGARETRGAPTPRVFLAPKTAFPFPFKRLPRRLAWG